AGRRRVRPRPSGRAGGDHRRPGRWCRQRRAARLQGCRRPGVRGQQRATGRPAHRHQRRPHLRGPGPGALRGQPQQRQDGLCPGRCRRQPGRRRGAGQRPGAPDHPGRGAADRRALGCADARCGAGCVPGRHLHRRRRSGRLHPQAGGRAEDQEDRRDADPGAGAHPGHPGRGRRADRRVEAGGRLCRRNARRGALRAWQAGRQAAGPDHRQPGGDRGRRLRKRQQRRHRLLAGRRARLPQQQQDRTGRPAVGPDRGEIAGM
ncbi:hypothetical protein XPN_3009, partial [Xanthomonas arboricola pv. pruni MAFF 301427]